MGSRGRAGQTAGLRAARAARGRRKRAPAWRSAGPRRRILDRCRRRLRATAPVLRQHAGIVPAARAVNGCAWLAPFPLVRGRWANEVSAEGGAAQSPPRFAWWQGRADAHPDRVAGHPMPAADQPRLLPVRHRRRRGLPGYRLPAGPGAGLRFGDHCGRVPHHGPRRRHIAAGPAHPGCVGRALLQGCAGTTSVGDCPQAHQRGGIQAGVPRLGAGASRFQVDRDSGGRRDVAGRIGHHVRLQLAPGRGAHRLGGRLPPRQGAAYSLPPPESWSRSASASVPGIRGSSGMRASPSRPASAMASRRPAAWARALWPR